MVIFPMARATWIARQNLYGVSDVMASMLSIISIAGMTVVRLGVP